MPAAAPPSPAPRIAAGGQRAILLRPQKLAELLAQGLDPDQGSGNHGRYALLHLAAEISALESIELLIRAGATLGAIDRTGRFPLSAAASSRDAAAPACMRALFRAGARLESAAEIQRALESSLLGHPENREIILDWIHAQGCLKQRAELAQATAAGPDASKAPGPRL